MPFSSERIQLEANLLNWLKSGRIVCQNSIFVHVGVDLVNGVIGIVDCRLIRCRMVGVAAEDAHRVVFVIPQLFLVESFVDGLDARYCTGRYRHIVLLVLLVVALLLGLVAGIRPVEPVHHNHLKRFFKHQNRS